MYRLLIISLVLVSLGCARQKSNVVIAGSTSVEPFVEKLAGQFREENHAVVIDVQGGGSTAGIEATCNGSCNIGTSSRNLKPSEQGLKVFIISYDGIAIIVNKANPVDNLTEEELRGLFSGEITNWQKVGSPRPSPRSGGSNSKIIPVTREEGSGTRGAFEDLIMGKEAISDACLVQDSNGAVREIIANTPAGIGYISAGLVDERVRALKIDGIAPTTENFLSKKYKFVRPFLLLTKDEPTGSVKQFIDYILSPAGQNTLKKDGLIPVQGENER